MSSSSSPESNPPPSSRVPENSGALARSASGMTSPAGVPATNRNSPPLLTSTALAPVLQPARSSPASASGAAALRTGHRVGVGGPGRLGVLQPDQPVLVV